jgi:Protein of unknown function (DUF2950)
MTFIVNQSGAVFEKDLGPNTETIATTMTDYNLDSTRHQIDVDRKELRVLVTALRIS